jgi:uncharacterized membrane protein
MADNIPKGEMSKGAYVLVLVGGIILLLFGLLAILGVRTPATVPSLLSVWGLTGGFVVFICGVVAIICARWVCTIVWSIVLIVVGLVGGGLGGILVILGGIIGLVVAVTNESNTPK